MSAAAQRRVLSRSRRRDSCAAKAAATVRWLCCGSQPRVQYTYPNKWLLPKDPSDAAENDAFASLATRCERHEDDPAWPVGRASALLTQGTAVVLGLVSGVVLANTLGVW